MKWLTASAVQGNHHAQYTFDKIYLMGDGVPRYKEMAAKWFMLAAEQGNEYARFFLDNMDRNDPFVVQAVVRILHHMSRLFRDEAMHMRQRGHMVIKARRKEREKKIALGHALDDYEQEQMM